MAITRISNYEIMKNQMSEKFLKYDQNKMILKFSLPHDETYIYIRFVGREYRISRSTGRVAWSEDQFPFMHFETVMFMLGHVLRRIRECMEYSTRSIAAR